MKISIIHPTRNRAKLSDATFRKWFYSADYRYDGLEYILSVDIDDEINYENNTLCKVLRSPNRSAIEAINEAAKISTGDLLVVISDDFDCQEHWDSKLRQLLSGAEDFLVKTRDGLQPTLITLPIMDRTYYNSFGYVYYPEYAHMFCDQEMTAVGHMLGKVINLDIRFEHLHYSTGKSPKDAVSERNDSTWVQGEMLFNERLKINFGIPENEIVKPYNEIQWR